MMEPLLFSLSMGIALVFMTLLVQSSLERFPVRSSVRLDTTVYPTLFWRLKSMLEPEAIMAVSAALISLIIVSLH